MKKELKKFLRAALAEHSFREAKELTDDLLKRDIDPHSHVFSATVAGIIVSYCRPFVEGQGIGKLEEEFEEFPENETGEYLKEAHSQMMEYRHKTVAHADLKFLEQQHQSGVLPNDPFNIKVRFTMKGYGVETTSTYMSDDRLKNISPLFEYQINRASKAQQKFCLDLLKKEKKLGEFIFVAK